MHILKAGCGQPGCEPTATGLGLASTLCLAYQHQWSPHSVLRTTGEREALPEPWTAEGGDCRVPGGTGGGQRRLMQGKA